MAAKRSVARTAAAAAPKAAAKTDPELVRDAYAEAVKKLVDVYFTNCIDQDPDPDGKFLRGLGIIRKARDRAIELAGR